MNFREYLKEQTNMMESGSNLKKYGIKELDDGLTIEILKKDFPWILKATIKDAILGVNSQGAGNDSRHKIKDTIIWYDGQWLRGEWQSGEWLKGYDAHGKRTYDSPQYHDVAVDSSTRDLSSYIPEPEMDGDGWMVSVDTNLGMNIKSPSNIDLKIYVDSDKSKLTKELIGHALSVYDKKKVGRKGAGTTFKGTKIWMEEW